MLEAEAIVFASAGTASPARAGRASCPWVTWQVGFTRLRSGLERKKFDFTSVHSYTGSMEQTATKIYEELGRLEQKLNQLKLEAFFSLPPKKLVSLYPQKEIQRALRETRNSIWQERYAKKVAHIS